MTETVLVWNGLVAESPTPRATAGSASPPDRPRGRDGDAVPVVHSGDGPEHAVPWTVRLQGSTEGSVRRAGRGPSCSGGDMRASDVLAREQARASRVP